MRTVVEAVARSILLYRFDHYLEASFHLSLSLSFSCHVHYRTAKMKKKKEEVAR